MDRQQELLRATTNTIWKYTQDQIPFVVVEEIYNKQIKQTECKLMGYWIWRDLSYSLCDSFAVVSYQKLSTSNSLLALDKTSSVDDWFM